MTTSTELATYSASNLDAQKSYATAVAGAHLLPAAYRGKPADVLVAMGLGQAIGIAPAQALYEIYVVNGRPSPSANLMAALVRRAGHRLRIEGDATRCTATLYRSDDPDAPFTATWTIEQARAAGLAGKDTWKQYPAAMLRARAISEVVRMGASEAVLGMDYSREEMQDVAQEFGEQAAASPKRPTGLAAVKAAAQAATHEPEPADDVQDAEVIDEPKKLATKDRNRLFALFAAKGIAEDEQAAGMTHILERPVEHRDVLTPDEYARVIAKLETLPDKADAQQTADDTNTLPVGGE